MAKKYIYTDRWGMEQKKHGRLNNAYVSPLRGKQTMERVSQRITRDIKSMGPRYTKKNT